MLKGIDPLLTPDLLHALASMGHGDELVLVDANFPAASHGRRLVTLAGVDAPGALRAILGLFPLDMRDSPAAFTMEVADDPDAIPAPVAEFAAVFEDAGLGDAQIGRLARQDFYDRAREAYVVVRSAELRPYGNLLLVKGVVNTV